MGTTGGDTDKLYSTMSESKVYVVISPQREKYICVIFSIQVSIHILYD
ncbi:hypothetical protein MTR67_003815 [Solanum verrucosum]|uniref:Uncharacterized protein n=1 Tax=Solanum verrucosum TaxID=315347 RepID=A0AAF0PV10_SOLVR|nr:hypothetical protein MTR67_003815 [Solanum verrucosum]